MDLVEQLVESSNRKQAGAGKFSIASLAFHALLVVFILMMSATATQRVDAEKKPIRVYLVHASSPPPPPPPPPPPAASSPAPHAEVKPVEVPQQQSFVQPEETPAELPKIEPLPSVQSVDLAPSSAASSTGAEPGGVAGGVVGGVAGGVEGGVAGGQIGVQIGGEIGGVAGGTPGGTGEGEAKPEGPIRVGGDVIARVVIHRVDPSYNDLARKARLTGVVIVEAVIDRNGNVDKVTVI